MNLPNLKKELVHLCFQVVEEKIAEARLSKERAAEALWSETKSSAGDKYETGREMAQGEIDRAELLLSKALKLKISLRSLSALDSHCEEVKPGALVKTDLGTFLIACPIGKVKIGQETFQVLGPGAPLSTVLMGCKPGDSLSFNQRSIRIKEVV